MGLGTLPPGGTYSVAYGISSSGHVVGEADTAGGLTHAFFYSSGTMTDLGTLPGGTYGSAAAITDQDGAVGRADTSTGDVHTFYNNIPASQIIALGAPSSDTIFILISYIR